MANKQDVLFSKEQIEAQIIKIAKTANSLQEHIHKTACSILSVWSMCKTDDKDTAAWSAASLTALQNASPYHKAAFAKWVAEFTPLQWADESKTWFAHTAEDTRMMGKRFREARNMPFFKLSPAPEAKPFIMADELEKLLAKAERHSKKPVEGDQLALPALQHIREALKAVKAMQEVKA